MISLMDKNKKNILWILIGLLLVGVALFFVWDKGDKEDAKKTEEVAVFDADKVRQEILGENSKNHKRNFILIKEDELTEEEKSYVDIVKNIPGPHQNGDLFVFAVKEGKETLSYFEDVTKDNKITIYFKKGKVGEVFKKGEDKYYVIGKVENSAKYEIAFMDVKTMKPLELEEIVVETKKTADEQKAIKEKEKAENPEKANQPVIQVTPTDEETTMDKKEEPKKSETKPSEQDAELPDSVEIIDDRKSEDSFEGISLEIVDTPDDK